MSALAISSAYVLRNVVSTKSTRTVRPAASVGRKLSFSVKAKVESPSSGPGGRASGGVPDAAVLSYAKNLPGISAPFPNLFDPAGLLNNATVDDVRRWREAEVMHCRVAMLAALGFVIGEQLEDFPVFMNFDGSITGPAINHFQQVQQGFWEPLLLVIGICEAYRVAIGWRAPKLGWNMLKQDYAMGDLMFDPLGLKPSDPAELKVLQTKELNNGRLAMVAIAGFVAQELVNKTEIFQHLFRSLQKESFLELGDFEMGLNLPVTPVPDIVLQELGKYAQ